MKDIDFLEGLIVDDGVVGVVWRDRVTGCVVTNRLTSPRDLDYQKILAHLQTNFAPMTPASAKVWQVQLIFDRWRAAYDLPIFPEANRLCYLVDHYRAALYSDLATFCSVDLPTLWKTRRWQTLLDLIDRLPSHSYYSSAVAQDPEHARMLAERIAAMPEEERGSKGPSLTSWTPEVAALTDIADAVARVEYAVVAVQAGSAAAGSPPKPRPRPQTPLEAAIKKAEHDRRKAKHQSLVARLLPGG